MHIHQREPGLDRRRHRRFGICFLGLLLALVAALTPSASSEQQDPLDARLNEEVVMIPAGPDHRVMLETTIFRPSGPGPFPLLVINHGKQPGDPRLQKRDRFIYMASAFVRRGYAVLVPMRAGFSHSTGRYVEYGCDMVANGESQADDVADAIDYARGMSWADADRIVVAGQSYGGLATMALASRAIPGVRGLMNFAGGLRIDGAGCDWKAALVKAYATFGLHAATPSMWMYGANDSYFSPKLASRFYRAFVRAGGQARLVAYGAFKRDAHVMLASRDGEKVWLPEVERFLNRIGMPTQEKYVIAEAAGPAKSNFAAIDNVDAIPFLSAGGRAAYRGFLEKLSPRAFAVSPTGAWGWAEEGEDTDQRALAACQSGSRQPCRLYSVDNYVVWPKQQSAGRSQPAHGAQPSGSTGRSN
jgi:dienelactone hydrolase